MNNQEECRPDILETGVSNWSAFPEDPEEEANPLFYENWSAHW